MIRNFLNLSDIRINDLKNILKRGAFLKKSRKLKKKIQTLVNINLAMIFEKPSTRTRVSFELAIKGNAKKVNMLVSDIYGGDYPQCNLPGDLVASAFGKCISIKNPSQSLSMGDIARGLLDVIAMNCAQLAYLNAVRFKITRIIFAGNFLRQNDLSMAMISYAIHYWSQGVMKACFLKHEGYFGSIGVMLLPDNEFIQ